jgi:hypothetical protein
MQYSVATILAMASAVLAQSSGMPVAYQNGTVYTTAVVTQYVTYCPVATTITTNGATYCATAGQTLTITDCPCTITTPVAAVTVKTATTPAVVVVASTTKPAASQVSLALPSTLLF